jgi:hypothetical protein
MTDFYLVGKTDAATAPIDDTKVLVYDHTAWVNGSTPADYADMLRGFTDGLSARLGYAVTLEIETENHGRDWYWIRRVPSNKSLDAVTRAG